MFHAEHDPTKMQNICITSSDIRLEQWQAKSRLSKRCYQRHYTYQEHLYRHEDAKHRNSFVHAMTRKTKVAQHLEIDAATLHQNLVLTELVVQPIVT